MQEVSSVNVVITTRRRTSARILFAVSVHYLDGYWKQCSHLLSAKYHTSVELFERAFLDILVKHNIQNKVSFLILPKTIQPATKLFKQMKNSYLIK